jgi:mannose-6-phosphate isomerase-like protein (cupin superfamily)
MPEPIPGPVVTAPGEGRTWNVVGDQITCKVASEQTEETYAVIEELSPPQGGTPLHLHRATDEVFYVVEGEYQVVYGDNKFNAPQGTLFVVPKRLPHTLRNISAAASRVLVTLIPVGFEKFFEEVNGVTDPQACGDRQTP